MDVSKADAKSQQTEPARARRAMRNPKVYAGSTATSGFR